MRKFSVFILAMVVVLLAAAAVAPVAFAQGTTGDKLVVGQNYVLPSGESLDGNLAVAGGSAEIQSGAVVNGDVSAMGADVTVDGTISGNVTVIGGLLRLNETARVEGNVTNVGGPVQRAAGAVVGGDTFNGLSTPRRTVPTPLVPDMAVQTGAPQSWFGQFINWQLGTLGSLLLMSLLGVVLVLIIPRHVGRVASTTAVQPGLTLIFGLLTLVLGVLAGGILLIACGLGLLVWLVLAAAGILGWTGVGLWLGQRLLNSLKMRSSSSIAEVLVGVVLITFLSRLPCIGWLFWLVFICWGLGAVVMTRFGTQDGDGPVLNRPGPVVLPSGPAGGSGGEFTPLPEPSDLELATRPIVPPIVPPAPQNPVVSATKFPSSTDALASAVPVAQTGSAVLTDIARIDAATSNRLQAAGIRTIADLAASNPVELATATGVPIGQILTEDWIGQAQRLA